MAFRWEPPHEYNPAMLDHDRDEIIIIANMENKQLTRLDLRQRGDFPPVVELFDLCRGSLGD